VLLVEVAQDVALILLVVGTANQIVLPVTGEHLGVMARRDRVETETASALEQQIKFDMSIALNARIRRLSRLRAPRQTAPPRDARTPRCS